MSEEGRLQDFSVDQAAGAVVLVLGAVAGLLQVIWMSKCHCKVNLFSSVKGDHPVKKK